MSKKKKRRKKSHNSNKAVLAVCIVLCSIFLILLFAVCLTEYIEPGILFGESRTGDQTQTADTDDKESIDEFSDNTAVAESKLSANINETAESETDMDVAEVTETSDESDAVEIELEKEISEIVDNMSLDEKICQMFVVTPEQLTGAETVTAAGEQTEASLKKYPVGGIIYFASNIVSPDQTEKMLENTQEYAQAIEGLPLFLCIDEEGGRVARIADNSTFGIEDVGPMGNIKTDEDAYEAGETIGKYLYKYGFNVDFAPDADVITNTANTVIGDRSFGSDPDDVTSKAVSYSNGLHAENVMSTFKHFPGHGATEADTHEGYAYTDKTYEEMLQAEMKPFEAAGDNDVDFIMVAHISVPNIVGDDTPCTLSKKMITDILRGDLGYDGIIITDAMNMGAITESYGLANACVLAVEAGNDMLLMPSDIDAACSAIKSAVESGQISEDRIDQSVTRIVRAKLSKLQQIR